MLWSVASLPIPNVLWMLLTGPCGPDLALFAAWLLLMRAQARWLP
ncbi:MAG: hypothetical protein AB1758_35485 [Candidatus Eremiobacterota bacterium]